MISDLQGSQGMSEPVVLQTGRQRIYVWYSVSTSFVVVCVRACVHMHVCMHVREIEI